MLSNVLVQPVKITHYARMTFIVYYCIDHFNIANFLFGGF